jgi:hypothetical protein
MSVGSKLLVVLLASLLSCGAFANDDLEYENWLIRVGDHETLARSWWGEAMFGNAEKQERLAELFLGPHAREAKARPYEGVHFLFRAAVSGRRKAMLRLAEGLNKGEFGLSKRPDAAKCWSSAPTSFAGRLACVELTDFRDPLARVPCLELAVIDALNDTYGLRTHDGGAMAQLCVANKTPAILSPGPPPSEQTMARVREYERHGIDWAITGCVYNERFEIFRGKFNQTIFAALEAQHGRGYLDRLSKEIDARVSGK